MNVNYNYNINYLPNSIALTQSKHPNQPLLCLLSKNENSDCTYQLSLWIYTISLQLLTLYEFTNSSNGISASNFNIIWDINSQCLCICLNNDCIIFNYYFKSLLENSYNDYITLIDLFNILDNDDFISIKQIINVEIKINNIISSHNINFVISIDSFINIINYNDNCLSFYSYDWNGNLDCSNHIDINLKHTINILLFSIIFNCYVLIVNNNELVLLYNNTIYHINLSSILANDICIYQCILIDNDYNNPNEITIALVTSINQNATFDLVVFNISLSIHANVIENYQLLLLNRLIFLFNSISISNYLNSIIVTELTKRHVYIYDCNNLSIPLYYTQLPNINISYDIFTSFINNYTLVITTNDKSKVLIYNTIVNQLINDSNHIIVDNMIQETNINSKYYKLIVNDKPEGNDSDRLLDPLVVIVYKSYQRKLSTNFINLPYKQLNRVCNYLIADTTKQNIYNYQNKHTQLSNYLVIYNKFLKKIFFYNKKTKKWKNLFFHIENLIDILSIAWLGSHTIILLTNRSDIGICIELVSRQNNQSSNTNYLSPLVYKLFNININLPVFMDTLTIVTDSSTKYFIAIVSNTKVILLEAIVEHHKLNNNEIPNHLSNQLNQSNILSYDISIIYEKIFITLENEALKIKKILLYKKNNNTFSVILLDIRGFVYCVNIESTNDIIIETLNIPKQRYSNIYIDSKMLNQPIVILIRYINEITTSIVIYIIDLDLFLSIDLFDSIHRCIDIIDNQLIFISIDNKFVIKSIDLITLIYIELITYTTHILKQIRLIKKTNHSTDLSIQLSNQIIKIFIYLFNYIKNLKFNYLSDFISNITIYLCNFFIYQYQYKDISLFYWLRCLSSLLYISRCNVLITIYSYISRKIESNVLLLYYPVHVVIPNDIIEICNYLSNSLINNETNELISTNQLNDFINLINDSKSINMLTQLSIYEYTLQLNQLNNSIRLLANACNAIGGSLTIDTTKQCLQLCYELLHRLTSEMILDQVVECIDFITRLEDSINNRIDLRMNRYIDNNNNELTNSPPLLTCHQNLLSAMSVVSPALSNGIGNNAVWALTRSIGMITNLLGSILTPSLTYSNGRLSSHNYMTIDTNNYHVYNTVSTVTREILDVQVDSHIDNHLSNRISTSLSISPTNRNHISTYPLLTYITIISNDLITHRSITRLSLIMSSLLTSKDFNYLIKQYINSLSNISISFNDNYEHIPRYINETINQIKNLYNKQYYTMNDLYVILLEEINDYTTNQFIRSTNQLSISSFDNLNYLLSHFSLPEGIFIENYRTDSSIGSLDKAISNTCLLKGVCMSMMLTNNIDSCIYILVHVMSVDISTLNDCIDVWSCILE